VIQPRLSLFCHMLLSKVYFRFGQFDGSIETIRVGLDLCNEKGIKDISSSWIPLVFSKCYREQGRLEDAIRSAEESLGIFKEMGNRMGQANCFLELHEAYLTSGNIFEAEQNVRSGLSAIEDLNLPIIQCELKTGLAIILTEREAFGEALSLLQDAEKNIGHAKWHECMISCSYACLYAKQNMMDQAVDRLLQILSLCEVNRYDTMIIREKAWIVPVLVEIFSRGEMKTYIHSILKQIGDGVEKELCRSMSTGKAGIKKSAVDLLNHFRKATAASLKVRFFGKFRVFIGEEEIPAKRWKSKKALMIFKYLLFNRSRGFLKKEVLMELLWPEEDPEKTAKRFHVALASLRKILEPEILKGIPSSYVTNDGDAYNINIGSEGCVDIEQFLQELELARQETIPEKAIVHYLNADAKYDGDFLEEDLYIDWCGDERERFKREYLHTLNFIIDYFEKRHDYHKSIEYAHKYLRFDKYAEPVYQALMRCYAITGNNAMVIKTFQQCKDKIMTELNCPLSMDSLELYERLGVN